jgi:AcrR family transcriptional regulator
LQYTVLVSSSDQPRPTGQTSAEPDPGPGEDLDLIWLRPERGERARRPPLSRERIVRAAVELADADGLEGLSMRRIAARLGAGTNSLYWYLKSKSDLFELMFDEVLGELELPERSSEDWRADLREIARQVWLLFRRHSWLALLGIQPGLGPNTSRYFQHAQATLRPLGLPLSEEVRILAALNNYVGGHAQRAAAWDAVIRRSGLGDQAWRERFLAYLDTIRASDSRLAALLQARLELSSEDEFLWGLDRLLDGIAAEVGKDHGADTG